MQELSILIIMVIPMVTIIAIMALLVFRMMEVVGPDELLILYGVERPVSDDGQGLAQGIPGRNRGYSIITEGRVLTIPRWEKAAKMDIHPMEMTWKLPDVRTRDEDRIAISASATVIVDMTPKQVEQFVELFLGRPQDEIAEAAKKTLESHIRSIASVLDAEDFSAQTGDVETRVVQTAAYDLEMLGLKAEALTLE